VTSKYLHKPKHFNVPADNLGTLGVVGRLDPGGHPSLDHPRACSKQPPWEWKAVRRSTIW
jgi:hypothetical protein